MTQSRHRENVALTAIDRYTKVLLTVIAINMTVMVGWSAAKVLVPEVVAGPVETVRVLGGNITVDRVPSERLTVEVVGTVATCSVFG